jgi:hypothetical protein
MISDICYNITCNVILPYRLSKDINITREIRQENPLFLVLFLIVL